MIYQCIIYHNISGRCIVINNIRIENDWNVRNISLLIKSLQDQFLNHIQNTVTTRMCGCLFNTVRGQYVSSVISYDCDHKNKIYTHNNCICGSVRIKNEQIIYVFEKLFQNELEKLNISEAENLALTIEHDTANQQQQQFEEHILNTPKTDNIFVEFEKYYLQRLLTLTPYNEEWFHTLLKDDESIFAIVLFDLDQKSILLQYARTDNKMLEYFGNSRESLWKRILEQCQQLHRRNSQQKLTTQGENSISSMENSSIENSLSHDYNSNNNMKKKKKTHIIIDDNVEGSQLENIVIKDKLMLPGMINNSITSLTNNQTPYSNSNNLTSLDSRQNYVKINQHENIHENNDVEESNVQRPHLMMRCHFAPLDIYLSYLELGRLQTCLVCYSYRQDEVIPALLNDIEELSNPTISDALSHTIALIKSTFPQNITSIPNVVTSTNYQLFNTTIINDEKKSNDSTGKLLKFPVAPTMPKSKKNIVTYNRRRLKSLPVKNK